MSKPVRSFIGFCLIILVLIVPVQAARELIPVGCVVGLQLQNGNVCVEAIDDAAGVAVLTAGVQVGDVIRKVDDIQISSCEDVRRAVERAGNTVKLTIERKGKLVQLSVPLQNRDGGKKLGLYLRQGVSGVGTVTWYDPQTGQFGTLGHSVNDPSGKLLQMTGGYAYAARVQGVRKGKIGQPGQLLGTRTKTDPLGVLTRNTQRGLFGQTETGWEGKALEVAESTQVKTGNATILSNVQGEQVQEYSVEILKIYPNRQSGGRNLLLKVTDPVLLEITGGIVQGMSGSPIIQDGKLVGAVTHVLVNDPTTGYGIFIENMLDAAG